MQLHMVDALKSNIPARSYLGWSEDTSSQSFLFSFQLIIAQISFYCTENAHYNVACFLHENIGTHSITPLKLVSTLKVSHGTKAFTNIFSPPFYNNIKTLFYTIYLSSVYFRRLVSMFNCCQYTAKSSVLNYHLLCSVQLDE